MLTLSKFQNFGHLPICFRPITKESSINDVGPFFRFYDLPPSPFVVFLLSKFQYFCRAEIFKDCLLHKCKYWMQIFSDFIIKYISSHVIFSFWLWLKKITAYFVCVVFTRKKKALVWLIIGPLETAVHWCSVRRVERCPWKLVGGFDWMPSW